MIQNFKMAATDCETIYKRTFYRYFTQTKEIIFILFGDQGLSFFLLFIQQILMVTHQELETILSIKDTEMSKM